MNQHGINVSNGYSWDRIMKGPQGPTGENFGKGANGGFGPTGPTGDVGVEGDVGRRGMVGSIGVAGDYGIPFFFYIDPELWNARFTFENYAQNVIVGNYKIYLECVSADYYGENKFTSVGKTPDSLTTVPYIHHAATGGSRINLFQVRTDGANAYGSQDILPAIKSIVTNIQHANEEVLLGSVELKQDGSISHGEVFATVGVYALIVEKKLTLRFKYSSTVSSAQAQFDWASMDGNLENGKEVCYGRVLNSNVMDGYKLYLSTSSSVASAFRSLIDKVREILDRRGGSRRLTEQQVVAMKAIFEE